MQPSSASERESIDALKAVSARLGADPSQIQAGGGNTSIKLGDRLIVKASGKALKKALQEEVFVSLSLEEFRGRCAAGTADPFSIQASALDGAATPLKPSIETAFHALLDATVVLHTHSTSVLAHAIAIDGPTLLEPLLEGLPWAWVPYVKPGLPLAQAILAAAAGRAASIFILANHGVVATGSTLDEAVSHLETVERRLVRPLETGGLPDLERLAAIAARFDDRYELPADPFWHNLGTHSRLFEWASGGSLYPDHVVFLGPAVWHLRQGSETVVNRSSAASREFQPLLLVEGAGCLVLRGLDPSRAALAACLADVAAKSLPGAKPRYLSSAEEAELVHWDAEHYRQKLAGGR